MVFDENGLSLDDAVDLRESFSLEKNPNINYVNPVVSDLVFYIKK